MNRERVQMLRDMIAGIPARKVNLDTCIEGDGTPCGTIACIVGWASIYPPFADRDDREGWVDYFDVHHTSLFGTRRSNELGTHKEVALKRLDALLK